LRLKDNPTRAFLEQYCSLVALPLISAWSRCGPALIEAKIAELAPGLSWSTAWIASCYQRIAR